MIRKTLLAAAAVATLAAGALSPTSASAFHGWKGHHFGHHFGFRHHYWGVRHWGHNCFWVKKWTPWGVVIKKRCYW